MLRTKYPRESRMREIRTYGLMRGRAPQPDPLYSTPIFVPYLSHCESLRRLNIPDEGQGCAAEPRFGQKCRLRSASELTVISALIPLANCGRLSIEQFN